jgi:hypothetical protein
MLRQLYELGLKGHPQEFLSYRIIYLLHTRNRSGKSLFHSNLPLSPSPQVPSLSPSRLVLDQALLLSSSPPLLLSSSPPLLLSSSTPLLLSSTKLFKLGPLFEQTSLIYRYGSPPSPTHSHREIRSRSPPRTPNSRITSHVKLRPFFPFIQYCTQHVGVYIGSFCGEGTDECFDYYVQGVSLFLSFSCPSFSTSSPPPGRLSSKEYWR